MKVESVFSKHVPKELVSNLHWRANVLERAMSDIGFASAMREACAHDPVFFLNSFGWTYNPKEHSAHPKRPFILHPFQDDSTLELILAIGDHDLLIEKSRTMGASWMCIAAPAWCWLFHPGQSFLFSSRVEDYVDKPGNPKALFWKLDYLLRNLPKWLLPEGFSFGLHRSRMHIENPENGSVIDGESTTPNLARGDRRSAILLDEFGVVECGKEVLKSTRDATQCRIFNSTASGVTTAFYAMRQTEIKKLRLHWSSHPVYRAGLYTTDDNGDLKLLDPIGYPEVYLPTLDGKVRSPWYDKECSRAASSQEIAQELDIDYGGTGYRYFTAPLIEEAIRKYARPPMLVGELEYDDTTGDPIRFVEKEKGHLRLWCLLDGSGNPTIEHKTSMGVDVSAGTGASNSCLQGYDVSLSAKVFEYVNPYIRPEQFAKQAFAIASWFGKSYMIWESGGPGRQFGSRIIELGYGNIYLRKNDESLSGRISDVPGFATTPTTKALLLGEYRAAVEKGDCINRSKEAMDETLEYIFSPDGGIEHSRSSNKDDPSGAKANHGDRVMADALAWKLCKERPSFTVASAPAVPIGCLRWRQIEKERTLQLASQDGW
jgi:hypothetical protein